jgi:hypothetical protein
VTDVPKKSVNHLENGATLANQQQITDMANEDSSPLEEHQPVAQVTGSAIPGPDPLASFSLEYVDSAEPAAGSSMVFPNSSHVAHKSSVMTFEIDIIKNQWTL